jgi:MFS family permease
MKADPLPTATAAVAPHAQVAFAALRHGDFRVYFTTLMLSMMGDNIEHVITYWVIFQTFHSPLLGGFAIITHWLPFLLFSIYFGLLADRFDCRRLIQIAQLMFLAASLGWGVLILTGTLEIWHAAVLLIIHGFAAALWAPAGQLIIHDIVGPGDLQSAVRLNSTGRHLGTLLGPAVGGGLILVLGPGLGMLVNGLLYLPTTLWLLTVPYTGHRRDAAGSGRRSGMGLGDAVRVLRQIRGDRVIVAMVSLVGLTAFMIGNGYQAQMPSYAVSLGTGEAGLAYSALLAANALGAVVAGVVLESLGLLRARASTAVICAMLWCVAMGAFAVTRDYPVALLLLVAAGFLSLTFGAMAQTLVQLRAPTAIRGRVLGLFNMAQQGMRSGSGATVGVLGSAIGVHWSLGLSAAVMFLAGAWLLSYLLAGRRERQSAEA